jgi:hypothetical protein
MNDDSNCTDCKHLQAHHVCGCVQSPLFGKKVGKDDRCDYFVLNPAQAEYCDALKVMLETNSSAAGIPKLRRSLELGLPEDDELSARFALSDGYREIVGNSNLSAEEMARRSEFAQAIEECEKAVEIDRRGGYGYFAQPLNRARLFRVNFLYQLRARLIEKERGNREAIEFVEKKLELFQYLPSTPLVFLLGYLAQRYRDNGQLEKSRACLQCIIAAEPVIRSDGNEREQERDLRDSAARALRQPDLHALSPDDSEEAKLLKKARNSVIYGFVGLFFLGFIFGPIAVISGFKARAEVMKRKMSRGLASATTGIVVGALATLIWTLWLIGKVLGG